LLKTRSVEPRKHAASCTLQRDGVETLAARKHAASCALLQKNTSLAHGPQGHKLVSLRASYTQQSENYELLFKQLDE
jgi:hypothetical protein